VNLDIVFRVAAIGIVIAFLDVVLQKARREEYAQIVTVVGVAAVFLMVAEFLSRFFQAVKAIFHI
jgi:stage III sporulation protein AC